MAEDDITINDYVGDNTLRRRRLLGDAIIADFSRALQLSTVSGPLSAVHCQMSTVSCPLSAVH